VKVVLHSGEADQKSVKARIAEVFQDEDLALLKTDEPVGVDPLPLSDDAGLAELNKVVIFGYPFGKMLTGEGGTYPAISVNIGHISSLRKETDGLRRIQLDAAANPGNSGGPVLDKNGKVIGVIVSGFRGSGVNFAIPASKIIPAIQQPVLSLRSPE